MVDAPLMGAFLKAQELTTGDSSISKQADLA